MGDFAAAVPDLERVVSQDPKYDFHRAAALLAHAYANTGQPEKAEALFPRSYQDLDLRRRLTTTTPASWLRSSEMLRLGS